MDRATIEAKLAGVIDEASKNLFEAKISGGRRPMPQLTFNRLILGYL
ncbi:MAG: hypothetical protein LBG96_06915 [Tannerella sp.]|jgi:hypothetical protein|nr:hypothetical protein [Tannerella sp.]